MIPVELLSAFFAASILLGLAPGPDNIFVLTQSALHGKGAGFSVTLGLCTGLVVHTLAVAMGVAVIFQVSATAFTALKLVGAAYLLYLAWQAFRAAAPVSMETGGALNRFKLYRRGILMNITNPKVSIFFLAFLPQFADPDRGPVSVQILLLGALFIVATILVFGSVALLAGTLGAWLNRSANVQRALNRVAGAVFVGLALTLAVSRR
ncbi:Threonine/homoserine/homoserine lactone efflux protein [Geoalkalibacter ferrihydriticus]|uniref:Threonine transporter RhtB n=2 Tax=Geoalkalibacter ferrihydriticus TaxID=392333 RepID=A0A0C2HQC4_9BACT|nr:LysE family translocator [Geoalkalibacter ferrihydriticus]KIH77085.1 threonine transporter RhtB [Geoalkalibacter ferrihydriticus DSM 17813]SDL35337.1 Threonine/homoserine/homoserine lactone efflux protein [Geoalkalibacter ferrihydriticus]